MFSNKTLLQLWLKANYKSFGSLPYGYSLNIYRAIFPDDDMHESTNKDGYIPTY